MKFKDLFLITVSATILVTSSIVCSGCSSDKAKAPVYNAGISIDENLNISDFGYVGQSTHDGNYYYRGSVTLYRTDGGSKKFQCYTGKIGHDKGCRGVIYCGTFYNLDRNKWVTIDGIKYKASNILE